MSSTAILIVEDEAIIAADLAGKLGRLGYAISGTTGFGEEALLLARESRPDLVLMDIRLAGALDGVDAAEVIRRELDLPVIFLTAHSDHATLQRAKLAEPFGYILKPFEEREIATVVEMALYKHQAERSLRRAHDELELRLQDLEAANASLRESRQVSLGMMQDAVAARRQAEEANAQLRREVEERRRTERELRQAMQELRRSNEDLQQFAYVASHDLQEPLRMVSSFLGLLQRRFAPQLDDKARQYIGFAREGATRMSHLVRDLLEYSRVTGQGAEPQPCDTGQALDAALANLQQSAEPAGARITRDPLPEVLGDCTQITQLFQNLIANAIKFCAADRPCQVHVGARPQEGHWVLSVADNGIGIGPAHFDRIFVIFQRLHTREQYPGTGIGLAICKKIVELHGGRIWVESTVGLGTTFFFTLPQVRKSVPSEGSPAGNPDGRS
ncbi:MAG: ATP-binding protein [Thermodesulfobacteriota bacterium]